MNNVEYKRKCKNGENLSARKKCEKSTDNLQKSPTPQIHNKEVKLLNDRGYYIKSTIGEGSYSKVKKTFSMALTKDVAIKIIDRKKVPKTFRERFLPREIEILSMVDHSNIVRVHDIFENVNRLSDTVYIVTEYMSYGDLLEYVKINGHLSERKGKRVIRDVLKAVSYLHSNGIAHRDIKCENILLDVDMSRRGKFVAKICDFGFARNLHKESANNCKSNTRETNVELPQKRNGKILLKTFCGSAAYAAPEVLLSQPHDPMAADVWAIGVVAFITLYGRMPYDDAKLDDMIQTQLRGDFPKVETKHSDLALIFVQSSLHPDPESRPSARNLLDNIWFYCVSKNTTIQQ